MCPGLGKACLGGLSSNSCHHMVAGCGTGAGAGGGRPGFHLSLRSLRASQSGALTQATFGFLTIWQPQDAGTSYVVAQGSSRSVLSCQAEAALSSMTFTQCPSSYTNQSSRLA